MLLVHTLLLLFHFDSQSAVTPSLVVWLAAEELSLSSLLSVQSSELPLIKATTLTD